ncbi:hypothetical protein [Pseudomonas anguilliseptica]|uniref:Uncharacterized protein n=1 Tax=Pseudomonas anguilliseptica TaxID=53406 RepID=A0A1H5LBB9_PSEAG|nr:hypothetical protein [Pseudomonas anguilliseptica]SEE74294.1 hypothetical protein SAMN05421553_4967 [Pseudomonas anguilliseptica]
MSRRYPDGTRKQYQSFLLHLNVDVIQQLDLPKSFTRHNNDLSFLVNELLSGYVNELIDIKENSDNEKDVVSE